MGGHNPTTEEGEGTTANDSDVEVGVPVQPVRARSVGDVRKVVPGHGTKNGGTGEGDSGGAPDVPPLKERGSLAKPLVEVERKPTPKVNEPEIQEVITLAQRELVEEV